ncbi:MAG: hypothetical protein U1D68_13175 [Arthrobacter sp.]|nr:hypothetical protein [Arthrobacter sp.]MDZ4352730.1 hypothetical protein [Arthrobacter sp.]
MEQLTTIAAELKRMDAGRTRPRPQQTTRPTQRYRLTDRFTPDELNQLVARYQAGEMSTALAKESGISTTAFLRLLAERGVRTRSRKLTAAQGEKILQFRRQGMTIRNIAKQVGCSYDTARIFLLTSSEGKVRRNEKAPHHHAKSHVVRGLRTQSLRTRLTSR